MRITHEMVDVALRAGTAHVPQSIVINFDYFDLRAALEAVAPMIRAEEKAVAERLWGQLEAAYNEGFSEGMRECTSHKGGKPWRDSRARARAAMAVVRGPVTTPMTTCRSTR